VDAEVEERMDAEWRVEKREGGMRKRKWLQVDTEVVAGSGCKWMRKWWEVGGWQPLPYPLSPLRIHSTSILPPLPPPPHLRRPFPTHRLSRTPLCYPLSPPVPILPCYMIYPLPLTLRNPLHNVYCFRGLL